MWSFFSRDQTKFPYEIGEVIKNHENHSIFNCHKGKKKGSEEEVTIFVYDVKNGSDVKLDLAKSFLKRLKTLRHPSLLTFLDSCETEKSVFIATEAIEPLGVYIDKLATDGPQRELYLAWGIFQITVSNARPLFILAIWVFICFATNDFFLLSICF
jgi:SCY1-like protein 1